MRSFIFFWSLGLPKKSQGVVRVTGGGWSRGGVTGGGEDGGSGKEQPNECLWGRSPLADFRRVKAAIL